MAKVQLWQNNPDARGVVLRAVQSLSDGRVVVFPTDTGYVLSADARQPVAVEGLGRDAPLALAVGSLGQALDVLPDLNPVARRLARRCWPGPVTLLYPDAGTPGVPAGTRVEGFLPLCSPAHSAILHALHQLARPLAVTPLAGGQEGLTGLGAEVALAIDDGPCLYPQGATVVRVQGERWEVVREGVVSADQLRVRMACLIVFVCTGNTCRSPMAEVLFKKRLAERLGCSPDELPDRGHVVLSAGLSAYPDDPAAISAVEVARGYGMDLGAHKSQALDQELAAQADHLVCMTAGHLRALEQHYPHLGCVPRLLSANGADLPDPVGQDETVYRACAARIWEDVEALVGELLPERQS